MDRDSSKLKSKTMPGARHKRMKHSIRRSSRTRLHPHVSNPIRTESCSSGDPGHSSNHYDNGADNKPLPGGNVVCNEPVNDDTDEEHELQIVTDSSINGPQGEADSDSEPNPSAPCRDQQSPSKCDYELYKPSGNLLWQEVWDDVLRDQENETGNDLQFSFSGHEDNQEEKTDSSVDEDDVDASFHTYDKLGHSRSIPSNDEFKANSLNKQADCDTSSPEPAGSRRLTPARRTRNLKGKSKERALPRPKKRKRSLEPKKQSTTQATTQVKRGVSASNQIRYISDPTNGVVILLMREQSAVTFYGKAFIRVLSGCVNVCGFDIVSLDSKFYPLYSSRDIFSFQIQVKWHTVRCSLEIASVERVLEEYCSPEKVAQVLQSWKFQAVIVMLKQFATPGYDFVSQYYPDALVDKRDLKTKEEQSMLKFRGFALNFEDDFVFQESRRYAFVADAVLKDIEQRVENREHSPTEPASRILVYGRRGIGKSSLLRYLINKVLSMCPKVMFLDCDPGQSEFTPPGCLSLTEVTNPLLGPPFTHIKTPEKTVFYGNVNIESSEYFIECVKELCAYYEEKFIDIPLFINTFGWLESLGKECLEAVEDFSHPTFTIELSKEEEEKESSSRLSSPDLIVGDRTFLILKSARPDELTLKLPPTAAYRRELSVLAYLGQCQPIGQAPKKLPEFIPYKIKISDVVLHCIDHDVDMLFQTRAISGSFVAMCCVEKENILVCDDKSKPKKLRDHKNYGSCLGFAFVRAVDEGNGYIYFITPEPYSTLLYVNALIKGDVHPPSVLMQDQGIINVELPHVRRMIKTKTYSSKVIGVQRPVKK